MKFPPPLKVSKDAINVNYMSTMEINRVTVQIMSMMCKQKFYKNCTKLYHIFMSI